MLRKSVVLVFFRLRVRARHHEELLLAPYKLIPDIRNSHSSSSFSVN